MTASTRAWLAWVPALAWAAVIFALSSQPVLPSPPGVNDKMAHGLAYAVLGAACLVGVSAARPLRVTARACVVAWILAVLYGSTDEFHQRYVPGRSPELADLAADAAGAAVAVTVTGASAILWRGRSMPRRS